MSTVIKDKVFGNIPDSRRLKRELILDWVLLLKKRGGGGNDL